MEAAAATLLDKTQTVVARHRALHTLKDLCSPPESPDRAAGGAALCEALHTTSSVLLLHEICYTLGQLGDPAALPALQAVLHNPEQDPVTRHEAAEALGAIGTQSARPDLERYLTDGPVEVRETVYLALKRLDWLATSPEPVPNPYSSIDPANPATEGETEVMGNLLLQSDADLAEQYEALFALRNRADEAAVAALCRGLRAPHSALLRHEIAFVLGQMEDARAEEVPITPACASTCDHTGCLGHRTWGPGPHCCRTGHHRTPNGAA
eukprot:TRINITY_DN7372_c0_g1_i2.p1 TRINITY_DN7372_c0_g1~~TRINITY_DN7372_c0_g1_i2.p1  ORF type:complete len:267 (+),score=40.34 TRINITY_DN7372_c0_g1_i2:72-872(+)